MASYISTILSGIWTFFEILKNVLVGIKQVVFIIIPNAIAMMNAVVAILPSVLTGFALAFIFASVVYLIVGR